MLARLALALLLSVLPAEAHSCRPRFFTCQFLDSNSAVFLGKMSAVQRTSQRVMTEWELITPYWLVPPGSNHLNVKFLVGEPVPEVGLTALVVAYWKGGNNYFIGMCSGLIKEPNSELAQSILRRIHRRDSADLFFDTSRSNVAVTVEGAGRRWRQSSAILGHVRFTLLPPGQYRITAIEGLPPDSFDARVFAPFTLPPGSCAFDGLWLRSPPTR